MEISKARLNTILINLLGGNKLLVDMWWNSPNKAFNGMTPDEVDNLEEVYTYLLQFLAR